MSVPDQDTLSKRESVCGQYYCSCKRCEDDRIKYVVFAMRCKSWDCQECREDKAREYKKRIRRLFDGRKLWFLTLTYTHYISPDLSWATYNQAWNRLRTNFAKQFGKFSFVRVLESHNKSPYPHLHLIVDKYFRPTAIGPAAVHAGFGWQINNKPISSDGAKHYISKYLTKPWQNAEGWRLRKLYRCRLISFSRSLADHVDKLHGWEMIKRAETYESCMESISIDRTWDSTRRYDLIESRDLPSISIREYSTILLTAGSYMRNDLRSGDG
jgi:hypothetical protein